MCVGRGKKQQNTIQNYCFFTIMIIIVIRICMYFYDYYWFGSNGLHPMDGDKWKCLYILALTSEKKKNNNMTEKYEFHKDFLY